MTTSEKFITENLKYFPEKKHQSVIENVKGLDEKKLLLIQGIDFKNPNNWLLLYLFCPFVFFIDRFLLKDTFRGLLKIGIPVVLLSLGGAMTIHEMKESNKRSEKNKQEESKLTEQIKKEYNEKEKAIIEETKATIFSGIKAGMYHDEKHIYYADQYGKLSPSDNISITANNDFKLAKNEITSKISFEKDSSIEKLHDDFFDKLIHDGDGTNNMATIGYLLIVTSIILFFIFMIADIFTIKERVRKNNFQAFNKIVMN